jgi:hypothetical protein
MSSLTSLKSVSRRAILFFFALWVYGCSGTDNVGTVSDEFVQARTKWAASSLLNYELSTRESGGLRASMPVYSTVVTNGVITKAVLTDGQMIKDDLLFDRAISIETLFNIVARAYETKAAQITVTYNSKYGYPERILINPDLGIADDEIYLDVLDFSITTEQFN